jgi:hypothetical protein
MPTPNAPRRSHPVMSETDSECGYGYVRHGASIYVSGTPLTGRVALWRVAGDWVASYHVPCAGAVSGPGASTKDGAVNALLAMLEAR